MKKIFCIKPKSKNAENFKNYIFTDDPDVADQIIENLNNSFISTAYEIEEVDAYTDYREYLFYES